MDFLIKILLLFTMVLIGTNCSSVKSRKWEKLVASYEKQKRVEFQQIKTTANDYLISKIPDEQLFNRIVFDTIYRSSSNLVVYHIANQNEILRNNMILIIVDNKMNVDSINTQLDKGQIRSYIQNPIDNKLLFGKSDLLRIAKQYNMEAGINSWKIDLSISGNSMNDFRWCLTNTLKKSKKQPGAASGKSLCVNIFNKEIDITEWQSIP